MNQWRNRQFLFCWLAISATVMVLMESNLPAVDGRSATRLSNILIFVGLLTVVGWCLRRAILKRHVVMDYSGKDDRITFMTLYEWFESVEGIGDSRKLEFSWVNKHWVYGNLSGDIGKYIVPEGEFTGTVIVGVFNSHEHQHRISDAIHLTSNRKRHLLRTVS